MSTSGEHEASSAKRGGHDICICEYGGVCEWTCTPFFLLLLFYRIVVEVSLGYLSHSTFSVSKKSTTERPAAASDSNGEVLKNPLLFCRVWVRENAAFFLA